MATPKLNVLVYAGTGITANSVRQCLFSLRGLLSPNYAVAPVSESVILKEPWAATCALLVIPGGADLGYCRVLNGTGNCLISDYVRRGGAYLGLCASAYYGSSRCEFEVGNKELEVIGSRELAFFPGTCRGGAFKGFDYRSEKGARAATLSVTTTAFPVAVPGSFASYFNGGGVFVDASNLTGQGVEVLASYNETIDVDGGNGKAAVVLCRIGEGKALLSGPHPEFAPCNLSPQPDVPGYDEIIRKLLGDDQGRTTFLKACLGRLGLEVSLQVTPNPPLSALHLSASDSTQVKKLLQDWESRISSEDGRRFIKGETDKFQIQNHAERLNLDSLKQALSSALASDGTQNDCVDHNAVTKQIIVHENGVPHLDLTPRFNHKLFFSSLNHFRKAERNAKSWGDVFLYGDVVASTNSLLEKNLKLISKLPSGFTFSAAMQIAGRGRGSNIWVAPPGALMFSTIINHPAHLAASRPVVFVQYVAAIAIVEAIRSVEASYKDLGVRIKWPNDIYALDPTKPASAKQYIKIGGILSQCNYTDGYYQIVLGVGINATNPRPTTSISDLLPTGAPLVQLESLLARILTRLEPLYAQFCREGFEGDLETRYYRHWLHAGQSITLEAEGGVKARVVGITSDWGLLRVEEVDERGNTTGKVWSLQSDENSFDFWKGLVRRRDSIRSWQL